MIDSSGFRSNIGIILANHAGRVFWAKRVRRDAWQFPQGGMNPDETPEKTLFRELEEEVGLKEQDVTILGRTDRWLRYRLPTRLIRKTVPICVGQKQLWFLLRLEGDDSLIRLDKTHKPEFDDWQWVSYWFPLRQVVSFKREVYRRSLKELAPLLFWRHAEQALGDRPLDYLL